MGCKIIIIASRGLKFPIFIRWWKFHKVACWDKSSAKSAKGTRHSRGARGQGHKSYVLTYHRLLVQKVQTNLIIAIRVGVSPPPISVQLPRLHSQTDKTSFVSPATFTIFGGKKTRVTTKVTLGDTKNRRQTRKVHVVPWATNQKSRE